jgi:hypothetical protein
VTFSVGCVMCVCVMITKKRKLPVEYSTLQTFTVARLAPLVEYKQLRMCTLSVQYFQLGPYPVPHLLCKVEIYFILEVNFIKIKNVSTFDMSCPIDGFYCLSCMKIILCAKGNISIFLYC